jgi:PhnB protein
MQISAYVFFYGRTEEAMKFYQSGLGGELEISRNGDSPMGDDVSDGWKSKVMHATLKGDGFDIMATDGREGSDQERESNIALAIGLSDEAKARDIFDKLSAGGKVTMPLEKQFWGALFGQFTDKFGIDWMINCG